MTKQIPVRKVTPHGCTDAPDLVAVEEPLLIRLGYAIKGRRCARTISVTMRTPGNDVDLALGLLFCESVIRTRSEVRHAAAQDGEVLVELQDDVEVDLPRLDRSLATASSCGICGKTALEAVRTPSDETVQSEFSISGTTLFELERQLAGGQTAFTATGGLHAAALFDASGKLLLLREDVGRHNAVDKLIGRAFDDGRLPLSERLLLISSRAGYEIVQKAAVAGLPVVAAFGAPTSMAVDLARGRNIMLIGFLRGERCNVYSHPWRLRA